MSVETAAVVGEDTASAAKPGGTEPSPLPTAPFSVVWSCGHPYVREGNEGRTRWVGLDDRGRPLSLTDADLLRRGWSRTQA
ncbi:hypothetical protein LX15_001535 [Streptoalloteichus tenebrarius]|uniref:Uncharacterized protein n=1 Tax=Streptoalloteichus tenebrarius (strain ATCC 17920 / DSM 40477 / JCM 4838 / CBS 697.72 / NBRC 16177 / NCIMB 11028 / NRRL B-12390 / A12253. 1 / ISP 5477) TaxID=1933 RepID=A0ABT1HQQ6_STRSD|nr:hypothetical protein [Streptoalloteichus tenebrarius]MCP2257849.1 hypothetical protein [Streptoalloteichus tenebrarius]BFE99789.1 hypothetical protein GCM10020241_14650 [Streptoalloteichus tenebrarius]